MYQSSSYVYFKPNAGHIFCHGMWKTLVGKDDINEHTTECPLPGEGFCLNTRNSIAAEVTVRPVDCPVYVCMRSSPPQRL